MHISQVWSWYISYQEVVQEFKYMLRYMMQYWDLRIIERDAISDDLHCFFYHTYQMLFRML